MKNNIYYEKIFKFCFFDLFINKLSFLLLYKDIKVDNKKFI